MNRALSTAGHKKAPTVNSRGEEANFVPFSQNSTHLCRRYPACPCRAADSSRRLSWDRANAGGLQQLAHYLGVHRFELLEHRWRLQIVAGLEREVQS